jgi:hypothetical protein
MKSMSHKSETRKGSKSGGYKAHGATKGTRTTKYAGAMKGKSKK